MLFHVIEASDNDDDQPNKVGQFLAANQHDANQKVKRGFRAGDWSDKAKAVPQEDKK